MNVRLAQTAVVFVCCSLLVAAAQAAPAPCRPQGLREIFLHPPDEAKPRGYWVWPHGNFDYAAIRHELAEFKAKGLGGVDIFDLGIQDRNDVIPPGPGFMSPEQVDGIAFALAEAKRLGLKMGLIVSSSWNAGATWTPPELAMMNLVAWRETNTGPQRLHRALPFPELPTSFRKPYGTFPLHPPRDTNGLPVYRRDVAVLAYPLDAEGRVPDPGQVRLLNDRLDASGTLTWDLPAGRWVVMRAVLVNFGQRLWLPSDRSQGLTLDHFSREATRHHFGTIIDRLEARVGPLRNTALERLYLASYEANAEVIWTPGFEDAFARQNGYRVEPYLPALYGAVIVDPATTERFLHDYRRTVSDLFVENLYREASRICRAHGLLLCSEAGGPGAPLHDVPTEELKALGAVDVMRGEFWNGKANQLTPEGFEELQIVKPIASAAHIYGHPVVEMESFTSHLNWNEGVDIFRPLADRAFCEGMTRVVYHTMSHNLPGAGVPGWTYQAGTHVSTAQTWWDLSGQLHAYLARCSALLMQGDFVADVARYYGDEVPLFAKPKHLRPDLGYGYDYDDLNTEILLRSGVNSRGELVLPSGLRYAVLALPETDTRMNLAVLEKLDVLVSRGATVVGPKPTRTHGLRGYPADEQRLRQLADRLWGESPHRPAVRPHGRGRLIAGHSLRAVLAEKGIGPDFDVHPPEWRGQVDFIHRRTADAEVYFVRNAGTNAVRFESTFRVRGKQPELWDPVLGTLTPAAVFAEDANGTRLPMSLAGHESVFVVFTPPERRQPHILAVSRGGRSLFPNRENGDAGFAARKSPDGNLLVQATVPGRYTLHLSNGRTRTVTLPPQPAPIALVGTATGDAAAPPAPEATAGGVRLSRETAPDGIADRPPPLLQRGPWEVQFPHGWDAPVRQVFETLHSWTDSTNAATRAFSGKATYVRQFEVPADRLAAGLRVVLDLGEVREIARVYLNGREAGLSTFAPHRLDVTRLVGPGTNFLAIEIANTWLNRLIADDSLPESQRKTHTNLTGPVGGQRWREATPRRSGLLGPVRLVFVHEIPVNPFKP